MKNQMIRKILLNSLGLFGVAVAYASTAHAYDNIIRPYQSPRSSGMGGVLVTTGLYDENFFGNPARVTANPKWKLQIFDVMAESTSKSISNASNLVGGGSDTLTKVANTAGNNLHARLQTAFPAIYIPNFPWELSFAAGIMTSTQVDVGLRRSYNTDIMGLTDIGPAVTVGKKLLDDKNLSVGITGHYTYRLATKEGYTIMDLIQGRNPKIETNTQEGAHIEFDAGSTYEFTNFTPADVHFGAGLTINNLLGGRYKNAGGDFSDKIPQGPKIQPRALGVGVSARRDSLFIFSDTVAALEFTDIGNNTNGSIYRLIHIGAETHWSILAPRVGINQGYWSAGLGLDLKFFSLDAATYGEEMALNSGTLQDRRFALKISFQI